VDDDSPKYYPALGIIQEGIDLLVSGGTVNVASGTYNETNVSVTKSLLITGQVGECPPDGDAVSGRGANPGRWRS